MKLSYSTILYLGLACFLIAAKPVNEVETCLENLRAKYTNAKSFSFSISVNMFDVNDNPVFSSTGTVKKSGDNYFSQIGDKTTLVNKKCFLIVDEMKKMLWCGNPISSADYDPADLEKMLDNSALMEKLKVEKKTKEGTWLKAVVNSGNYNTIRFLISGNHELRKVEYYYNQTENMPYGKVVIDYGQTQFGNPIPYSHFSERKYLSISSGNPVLNKEYAQYRLINQLDQ